MVWCVEAHAHGGRNPKHTRVVPCTGLVPGEVELLRSANEKVPGSVAGDLRVVPMRAHAVAVSLSCELIVMQPRCWVPHMIIGAQFKGPMTQAVWPWARVHEWIDHHHKCG